MDLKPLPLRSPLSAYQEQAENLLAGHRAADPGAIDLEGNHAHSTPLHQAVLTGNEAVVRLLVERGARLDIRDTVWQGTPLSWALYGGGKAQAQMAKCLRSLGAAE